MSCSRRILSSPGFLAGLALLLANDWLFKPIFHNALTGKLSDLAGLFVFPMFWTALFPRHKSLIFSLITAFFIFWKMPLSQPLIDTWNALGCWSVGRVEDPTDLWALAMLPLAWAYAGQARPLRTVPPLASLTVAFLAFAATSMRYTETYNKSYTLDFSESVLRERMLRDSVLAPFAAQLSPANPDTLGLHGIAVDPELRFVQYHARVEERDSSQTVVTLLWSVVSGRRREDSHEAILRNFEEQFIARVQRP